MQGDVVKAAKWLGGCMVLASFILVVGFHPTVTGRVVSFTKVQPEAGPQPVQALPATEYSSDRPVHAVSPVGTATGAGMGLSSN